MWRPSCTQTIARQLLQASRIAQHYTDKRNTRICVVGACGGVGLPLSLLLKRDPLVSQLRLYDLKNAPGIAADLSHIDTSSAVIGFNEPELAQALSCSEIVVISAGEARKPGMERDELFNKNAEIISKIITECATSCPDALIAIITNPLNSMVPLAAEILKKAKVYDPARLFGITTLDVVRSKTFISEVVNVDPDRVRVEVVGGHAGCTILPIISQAMPRVKTDEDETEAIVQRIQEAGTEIVKAKAGAGSATLSMGHAAYIFVNALLLGLKANGAATQCTYVESTVADVPFFASPIVLGKKGVFKNNGLPHMNRQEQERYDRAIPILKKEIEKGIQYANKGGS